MNEKMCKYVAIHYIAMVSLLLAHLYKMNYLLTYSMEQSPS